MRPAHALLVNAPRPGSLKGEPACKPHEPHSSSSHALISNAHSGHALFPTEGISAVNDRIESSGDVHSNALASCKLRQEGAVRLARSGYRNGTLVGSYSYAHEVENVLLVRERYLV